MPTRREVVLEQLDELRTDFQGLWVALTKDAKKEARKERVWSLFAGIAGAAGGMAARRAAAGAWALLTGETPPTPQAKPQRSQRGSGSAPDEERTEVGAAAGPPSQR